MNRIGANEPNHENVVPAKEKENNLTFEASVELTYTD